MPEDQALWFLTLPDKVKRQHFSREEQILLTETCERSLADATPEVAEEVYQRRLTFDREDGSACVPRRRSSETACEVDGLQELDFFDTDTISLQSDDSVDTAMEILKLYVRRRRSTSTYRSSLPPPPPPKDFVIHQPKVKSLGRSFQLTPLPLPPPTLAPVPPLPSPETLRNLSQAASLRRQHTEPLPEAKYYQDPNARKTLKEYATPQKFDEALEFGFPSTEQVLSRSSGSDHSEHGRKTSLTHSVDGDKDSLSDTGPTTPTAIATKYEPTVTQSSSIDSGVGLPLQVSLRPKTADRSRSSSFNNREMTLRVTLTRPALREPDGRPESELYGWKRKQTSSVEVDKADPLALQPLNVSDDSTGAHGAFAVPEPSHSKGLKRVWKSLRQRPSLRHAADKPLWHPA